METPSNAEVRNAESLISTGTKSASSDEISLAFSFWDEISAEVPSDYDVLNEICRKYKIPIIVITPPEEGPHYSEDIVFPDESYVTCCSELELSSEESEDIPVTPISMKSTWKYGAKKSLWKRVRSLFTCCCPWKKTRWRAEKAIAN